MLAAAPREKQKPETKDGACFRTFDVELVKRLEILKNALLFFGNLT